MATSAYPTSLASQQHDHQPDAVTPSHAGMVQGHEFDIPIQTTTTSPPQQQQRTPSVRNQQQLPPTPVSATPQPAQRRAQSSHRQRPVSMPPQAHSTPASSDRERDRHGDEGARRGEGSTSRSRGTSRILGDYTLSKTLGAGSMGKVKLAHHNVTGEKVRYLPVLIPHEHRSSFLYSLQSRSCHALPQAVARPQAHLVLKLRRNKPPRTLQRRFGLFVRRHSPCSCIIHTYAVCAK